MGHQRSPRPSCRAGKAAQSRPSLHLKVARIIYAQTQTVFPEYSHPNSPKTYTLPQLAACVMLCFYFKMSYRDFVELLRMSQELREALELEEVPHYSTLSRMYQRFRASHLDEMNRQ
ncbi:transposase, partial [Meiothermus sp. CFH 77666]|uniref:transposase n=1 Tax=Meiothermus sp. CFH 77666 TaxID=2817942 RepID=UPI001AA00E4B